MMQVVKISDPRQVLFRAHVNKLSYHITYVLFGSCDIV